MENARIIQILNKAISILSDKMTDICCVCDAILIQHTRLDRTHEDYITKQEHLYMSNFIYRNKPSEKQYTEFTENDYWIDDLYWWKSIHHVPETRQIRIDYLNTLISYVNSK